MARNRAGDSQLRRESRTDSSLRRRETLASAFTWGPRRLSGETSRMKSVAGSPSMESKSIPGAETPHEATSWSRSRVFPCGIATPFPIPVDIMDSRWSTLLRISPFVSTRCADSRSCTSSLMQDSLSRALSESEIASSFNSSDRCIGSPAGPRLGSETKAAGGSRVRTASRHVIRRAREPSSGKRPGELLELELPAAAFHSDVNGVARMKFSLQQTRGQRVLNAPLDQAAERTRAENRVVSFARQEIEHVVVRLEGDLLLPETAFHLCKLELDDLPERLPREGLENQDLVDSVQELGPEMPPERGHEAVPHGL